MKNKARSKNKQRVREKGSIETVEAIAKKPWGLTPCVTQQGSGFPFTLAISTISPPVILSLDLGAGRCGLLLGCAPGVSKGAVAQLNSRDDSARRAHPRLSH
eukprot:CAMPEP_0171650042 /NCGR_PEP_ID=MMETSP0990-20121206/37295_1 /TAXON_ID=483369 /ORGANISM="non described non described, Strain CCMP2098" /LENGTH=101 /DNA_ID=CAMNT_0012228339 /DNA_START=25 /DNA_END=331 /DNA_ORIENTATION=+